MMQKQFTFLSGLVLSVSCMVLHQSPVPVTLGLQYHDSPNYNFAYEVNDPHTGDIKNQHESRRGDTVLGQYSLLQPDGVRRTVDYRADDHAGFLATVNNEGRPVISQNVEQQGNNEAPRPAPINVPSYLWPSPAAQTPPPAPAVAVSRSSIVQTFSPVHSPIAHGNSNPWL